MRSPSLAPTIPARRDVVSLLPVVGAAVVSLLIGAVLVAKPHVVILLVALVLAVALIGVAFTRPTVAFVALMALTIFVPSYAAPAIGPFLFMPAAAACWALAVALGWRNLVQTGRVFRPTAIDACVGLFVLLMAISIAFSARATRNEYLHVMFLWLGPFLGVRLLLADLENPLKVTAAAFAGAAVIIAPIALLEYLGSSNPFHALNFNGAEYSIWAEQIARFGNSRASASFGHPIALSMFAAASALLSLAAGLSSEGRRERNLWYVAAAVAVSIQVFTVSRTGWVMLAVGIVGLVIVFARGVNRRRLLTLIASLVGAVLVLALVAPSALQSVPGFEKSSTQVRNSSEYRYNLIDRALEPGVLNAWGNTQNEITPFVNKGSATDNEYIILADQWGLIPTAALFLLMLALLWTVLLAYGRDRQGIVAFPLVALACMAGLFVVAFITQQQVMIWMMVGASAVTAERLGAARRRGSAQRTNGLARM